MRAHTHTRMHTCTHACTHAHTHTLMHFQTSSWGKCKVQSMLMNLVGTARYSKVWPQRLVKWPRVFQGPCSNGVHDSLSWKWNNITIKKVKWYGQSFTITFFSSHFVLRTRRGSSSKHQPGNLTLHEDCPEFWQNKNQKKRKEKKQELESAQAATLWESWSWQQDPNT